MGSKWCNFNQRVIERAITIASKGRASRTVAPSRAIPPFQSNSREPRSASSAQSKKSARASTPCRSKHPMGTKRSQRREAIRLGLHSATAMRLIRPTGKSIQSSKPPKNNGGCAVPQTSRRPIMIPTQTIKSLFLAAKEKTPRSNNPHKKTYLNLMTIRKLQTSEFKIQFSNISDIFKNKKIVPDNY